MHFIQRFINISIVFYGAGCLLRLLHHAPVPAHYIIATALIAAGVTGYTLYKKQHLGLVSLCLTLFLSGYALTDKTMSLKNIDALTHKYAAQDLSGIIEDIQYNDKKAKYTVSIKMAEDQDLIHKRIKFTHHHSVGLANIGDTITFHGTAFPINDPITPYSYNFKRAAFFDGIQGIGTIKGGITTIQTAPETYLKKIRHNLTHALRSTIPGSAGAIGAALITGDRTGIDPTIRQHYADSGIAHVLAISGLHISLVAGIIFLCIRRLIGLYTPLTRSVNTKKGAALLALPFVGFYVALSGFGYPAIRAMIMTTLVMMGIWFDRQTLSMRSVAIATLALFILMPECILSVSFQLSFAAVVALIAFYESGWKALAEKFPRDVWWGHMSKYWVGIILTTLIATAATTPLTIYTFKRFTLQAVLGNLIAIPLTSFIIMPLAVLTVISFYTIPLSFIFKAFSASIDLLSSSAKWISQLPAAAILVPQPHYGFMVCFTLGFLWLCLIHHKSRHLGWLMIFGCYYFMQVDHLPRVYMLQNGLILVREDAKLLSNRPLKAAAFELSVIQQETGLTRLEPLPPLYETTPFAIWNTPWKNEDIDIDQFCAHKKVISNGYIFKHCIRQKPRPYIIDKYQLMQGNVYVYG